MAEQELQEKFGMEKTSDFQLVLQNGDIEKAQKMLDFITKNKELFLKYNSNWFEDRKREIEFYQKLKNNGYSPEKMKEITKENSQQELLKKFGFNDTKGFQKKLQQGEIKLAKEWLEHIENNLNVNFPQYQDPKWLRDRKIEIARAEARQ